MSLIEVMAALSIMGLLLLFAGSYYGVATMGNAGAEGYSRNLALALVHARRATIATGDNHYLALSPSASSVSSYALFRRPGSGDVRVDQDRTTPNEVAVSSSHSTLEFDFDGSALAAYSIDVAGKDRSWNVSVVPVTGAVQVVETTP